MMHIGLAIACRSRVSEVPSLTLSAGLAPGWRCLCHVGRSGRGSIITLIILPSREGGFLEVQRKRGEGSLRFFLCSLPLLCSLLPSPLSLLLFVVSDADFANVLGFPPLFFPPTVSRAGQMSSASSHSKSRSVEISACRSRALSRPSGDSRSIALVYVSGGAALIDSGTADALAAMRSNFDVDSTVTTRRLVEVRKNYFIPSEYELHAPLPGERPYDAFSSGLSLSTDALEAGLRFPLHPVVEACLEGWQISPS
ncbi:hypothetical protein BHE74_00053821 [Ensete ventricosum]|nr:hypothetical protein BHE74_00053821 [Ensete ventricosum]